MNAQLIPCIPNWQQAKACEQQRLRRNERLLRQVDDAQHFLVKLT